MITEIAALLTVVVLAVFNAFYAILPAGWAADALSITTSTFRTWKGRAAVIVVWLSVELIVGVGAGFFAYLLLIDNPFAGFSVEKIRSVWLGANLSLAALSAFAFWFDRLIDPGSYRRSDQRWREEG